MGTTQTVSLLFTDLVGSTSLATRLAPAAADDLRREHFGVLRRAIGDHGGTEVKNLGDGLMVSFEGVASAVDCAISMQQGLERRNRQASPPLHVRIGVAVGDAVPEAGDWFGPPVVEAARLCNAADGGSIYVTDAVHMLLAGAHAPAMRPLGPLELKGLPAAVEAWSVEWERLAPPAGATPIPSRLRDQPATGLVGRGSEREQLAAAWAEAREGERRVVLICGEPGIGKTRLVAHLAHEAQREGAIVLYGRCDEDVGVPYQPWREALGHLVEVAPERAAGATRRIRMAASWSGSCPIWTGAYRTSRGRRRPIPRPSATCCSARPRASCTRRRGRRPCCWCSTTFTGRGSRR